MLIPFMAKCFLKHSSAASSGEVLTGRAIESETSRMIAKGIFQIVTQFTQQVLMINLKKKKLHVIIKNELNVTPRETA